MGLIVVCCQIIYKLLVFDIAMMRQVVVSLLMEINIYMVTKRLTEKFLI